MGPGQSHKSGFLSQDGSQDEPGQPDFGESQHIYSRKVRQMQRKKIKESN